MSDTPHVYVAALGMITPLGADAPMTAAMVRAKLSAFKYSDFHLEDDDAIRMALVPQGALDESLDAEAIQGELTARQVRLLQLAKLALAQLAPHLPKDIKLPLFIAGPEQLIDGAASIDQAFLENLSKQTAVNLNPILCRVLATGRAGGLAAINLAFRLFQSTDEPFALIAGVDTFYDEALLEQLLDRERLLVGKNMDGFIPGEAAAFILLAKHPVLLHNRKSVRLYEPGEAFEKGHRGSKETYRGDGLASACADALNNAQAPKIKTLYSSMNGEHFFSKEHGVAVIRNSELLEPTMKIEHPADCFGDLGAAFGPVAIGMTAVNALNNTIDLPCMVCCSSDRDARSAVVIHA